MQIYAHRAGRGLAPENTLEGCQIVLQHEVDTIDLDIGMTQDGHLVATHDPALNPDITKNRHGYFITEKLLINTLTYQQLSQYDVGQINPLSAYAGYFPDQKPCKNAKIPLLKEVIEFLKKQNATQKLQLEIKTDPKKPQMTAAPEVFARGLYQLLEETHFTQRVEVQSFDYRTLLCIQQLDTQIKTTYLTHPIDEKSPADLWFAGYSLKNFGHSYPKMIKALGGTCWSPFQMDLMPHMIEEAKKLDLKVIPWGYPEKEGSEFNTPQIAKLIEWNVDGIITDRPDTLRKMLAKY